MKKLLLPALIAAMGLGGAYASNKISKAMPTYRIEGSQCKVVDQECDELGEVVCTWNDDGINQLYKFQSPDETTCSQALRRSL